MTESDTPPENPYEAPKTRVRSRQKNRDRLDYASFLPRLGAQLIDGVITTVVSVPIGFALAPDFDFIDDTTHTGMYTTLSYLIPLVYTIVFWVTKGATPGKMALGIRVVDSKGANPTLGAAVIRYIGYLVSALPLGLGYLWMIWDDKNQTWHDKFASTFVIRN